MTSRIQIHMGTYISISLEEKNQVHFKNAFYSFSKIDKSLSSYKTTSDIYRLNFLKDTSINKYTYEALFLSKKYYEQTNGYFDVTVGSITKDAYAFGEDEKVPTHKELESSLINIQNLHFTKNRAKISQGIKVDLGGMGKGFAVDKAMLYLKQKKVKKAIISASGDIRCLGICKIDVQNPFRDSSLLLFETLDTEMGISTSGNYNRYVLSPKNNHLINPKLKLPQSKFVSITLISTLPSSDLDAYATAASVMPIKEAYLFLKSKNLAYIVIQSDLKLLFSANISTFTRKLFIRYAKEE